MCVILQVSSFTYGDLTVAVREGALGDGLGAKVWSVCHIMVRWAGWTGGGAQEHSTGRARPAQKGVARMHSRKTRLSAARGSPPQAVVFCVP